RRPVLKIRDGGSVQRKACYLALAITMDGQREVLGMWFQQTEGQTAARDRPGVARHVGVRDPVHGLSARCAPGRLHTNPIAALNRQLRKAIKTKGHFPNEEAARKLIYLAINNAVPQWTRTRGWTKALLAFKIHFG